MNKLFSIMTEKEEDTVKEIISIGIAKAADAFSAISHDKVLLNVLEFKIVNKEATIKEITHAKGVYTVLHSEILGDIQAHTFLVFSDKEVSRLVDICLKHEGFSTINSMVESLLLEVSNIITAAVVTSLADMLKMNIYGSVPSPPVYQAQNTFSKFAESLQIEKSFKFSINTNFVIKNGKVKIPFIIAWNKANLKEVLKRMSEAGFLPS